MHQYIQLLDRVLTVGRDKTDRTGTGTRSVFGHQMRFDLSEGFPLVTTKKMFLKGVIHELLWFLAGDTNIKYLNDNGVHIWDEWANKAGNLGPVYGYQWRSWPVLQLRDPRGEFVTHEDGSHTFLNAKVHTRSIDQIAQVVSTLKTNPDSRRLIVSAWNPAQVDNMALPPCHCLFQFYTEELTNDERVLYASQHQLDVDDASDVQQLRARLDALNVPARRLSCQLYQRSADLFLGMPFNIASYALLTMMIAQQVGMAPGDFIWTGGDCHIYKNHFDQVQLQLARQPYPIPKMEIEKAPSIFDYKYEDFKLSDYRHYEAIKAEISV